MEAFGVCAFGGALTLKQVEYFIPFYIFKEVHKVWLDSGMDKDEGGAAGRIRLSNYLPVQQRQPALSSITHALVLYCPKAAGYLPDSQPHRMLRVSKGGWSREWKHRGG